MRFYRRKIKQDGTYGKTKDGSIEYGLIAAAIAVVIIGAVALIGDSLLETFQGIADALG